MDMSGRGFVSVQDFLNTVGMKQIIHQFNHSSKGYKIGKKDVELFLVNSGVFRASVSSRTGEKELIMDQKSFKRVFFPHLCHANDKDEEPEFAPDLVSSVRKQNEKGQEFNPAPTERGAESPFK